MRDTPKISILSPSKNTGKYLRDTIESIKVQTYSNWEHIIIDAVSSDETLDVVKRYPHIRLISELNIGFYDALRRGSAMAQGDYIMICCISDGYLDKDWFRKCVEVMDKDTEVSLVWGFPQYMSENGTLLDVSYPQFHKSLPPNKDEFLYYWLISYFWFPESNFCVRKKVFDECLFGNDPTQRTQGNKFFTFSYMFNTLGYLSYFINSIASFGRIHSDKREIKNGLDGLMFIKYARDIIDYRKKLMNGHLLQQYRDGDGVVAPYKFDTYKFRTHYLFTFRYFLNMIKLYLRPIVAPLALGKFGFLIDTILRKIKKYF